MPNQELAAGTVLDQHLGEVSRRLASRTPRRSFIGRVGRLAVAAGAGGVGALLWADPALAVTCHDGRTSCNNLTYSAWCGCNNSTCPSGSCECGCWYVCDGACSPRLTKYCDCCQSGTSTCACSPARPKYCFPKQYAGGCGTVRVSVIRCRYRRCTTFAC
jgi:hypothetical protein